MSNSRKELVMRVTAETFRRLPELNIAPLALRDAEQALPGSLECCFRVILVVVDWKGQAQRHVNVGFGLTAAGAGMTVSPCGAVARMPSP